MIGNFNLNRFKDYMGLNGNNCGISASLSECYRLNYHLTNLRVYSNGTCRFCREEEMRERYKQLRKHILSEEEIKFNKTG